jgi:hypothetical protein
MTQQVIIPRQAHGLDWGAAPRLIAALVTPSLNRERPSGTLLIIVPGHSAAIGARGFGRSYNPAALVLTFRDGAMGMSWAYLAKGRITREVIREHAARIDAAFLQEIAATLDPRTTTWVGMP